MEFNSRKCSSVTRTQGSLGVCSQRAGRGGQLGRHEFRKKQRLNHEAPSVHCRGAHLNIYREPLKGFRPERIILHISLLERSLGRMSELDLNTGKLEGYYSNLLEKLGSSKRTGA